VVEFALPKNSKNRLGKAWMKHLPVWTDEKTHSTRLAYRPVHTYTLSNDVEYIKPKARVY
jgi:succinate dehydrogenase / fumarate reductase, flavoprotein subunit